MQLAKKIYVALILLVVSGISTNVVAQVTIGSEGAPSRAALLDIKDRVTPGTNNETATTGGVLLPRVLLVDKATLEPFISKTDTEWINASTTKIKEKHIGLQVYNLNETNGLAKGMFVWNGTEWEKQNFTPLNVNYFFYLPSFNIEITALGNMTVDLYEEYRRQFTRQGNPNFVSNSNYTLDVLPVAGTNRLYRKDELDYVITDFDETVINPNTIVISNTGVLTFDVISMNTSKKSYFNIMFVVKQ